MKNLIAISVLTILAQSVVAQDYDVKNTQSLQNQTGFIALELGGEITRDSAERAMMNAIEPASGEVIVQSPAVPVIVQEGPQVIIETKKVVGHTDTGVTPGEIMMAVEEM